MAWRDAHPAHHVSPLQWGDKTALPALSELFLQGNDIRGERVRRVVVAVLAAVLRLALPLPLLLPPHCCCCLLIVGPTPAASLLLPASAGLA